MRTRYYPDEHSVKKAMAADDPLLVCVREDGSAVLLSNIDDALEHHILLRKLGYADTDIDTYYRLILTRDGADWTFVCPSSYKGIADRDRRIERYFNDGIGIISTCIQEIGYDVPINIPQRYRRHFNRLKNGNP